MSVVIRPSAIIVYVWRNLFTPCNFRRQDGLPYLFICGVIYSHHVIAGARSSAISVYMFGHFWSIGILYMEVCRVLGFRHFPGYFFRVPPRPLYTLVSVRVGPCRRRTWYCGPAMYRDPAFATPTPSPDLT